MTDDEATFDVWQDGMRVASATGKRADAEREAMHYALVYGQDGPVEIKERRRRAAPSTLAPHP